MKKSKGRKLKAVSKLAEYRGAGTKNTSIPFYHSMPLQAHDPVDGAREASFMCFLMCMRASIMVFVRMKNMSAGM